MLLHATGLLNALTLVDKDIGDIRVVVCGCGAAGYTCATYFITLGVKKENLLAVDVKVRAGALPVCKTLSTDGCCSHF